MEETQLLSVITFSSFFRIALICILVLTSVSEASFEEGAQFARDMQQKIPNLEQIAHDLKFIAGDVPVSGKGCKDCEGKMHNIKESDTENGILVFTSFSMPKSSLIELSNQSQKYGAILVLRGLYKESFKATKEKIFAINAKGLRVNIHPELFKRYNVRRVPTFILVKDGKEVNRLSGNVTLDFAAKKLEGREQ